MGITTEQPIFSVSEFLDFANELLGAHDFSVVGEVVEAKDHPTGFYLTLKDPQAEAVLECYASPYVYRAFGVPIERGMMIKVGGAAGVWKKKGRFSFRIQTLELAGEGALKKAYEALKKKLQDEGLFDRKRALPEFITKVGLVTSKTGAVIDDFRRNLAPLGLTIVHCDVRVEGATAADQIIRALTRLNLTDLDVVAVIRGGGSMEDLAAFNNEHVIRAVFGSRIPTIVSIGHDRDVPLAQLAADASGSTPTAAAHIVNASWDRLRTVEQTAQRIEYAYESALAGTRADMDGHTHRLAAHLGRLAGLGRELEQRLVSALDRVGHGIAHMRQAVQAGERHLAAASPERLLRLGYSIVTDPTGAVIRSAAQLRTGQTVSTRLAKGSFVSEVQKVDK
jgi:exodeoxyribonuclease VII large subunit